MVIRVQTRDNEPVDKALRRLRKLCNNEGLTRTSKAKSYFEKPSERRRREARERQKAIRLAARARRQDVEKLLSRRRKARKNARAAARGGNEGERSERGERHDEGRSAHRGESAGRPRSHGPGPHRSGPSHGAGGGVGAGDRERRPSSTGAGTSTS